MKILKTPIKGWRCWRLLAQEDKNSFILSGEGIGWYDPIVHDHPPEWQDKIIDDSWGNGIYCFKRPEGGLCATDLVHGWIEMWGKIVVHEHGFRAESARILGFILYPTTGIYFLDDARLGDVQQFNPLEIVSRLEQIYRCEGMYAAKTVEEENMPSVLNFKIGKPLRELEINLEYWEDSIPYEPWRHDNGNFFPRSNKDSKDSGKEST